MAMVGDLYITGITLYDFLHDRPGTFRGPCPREGIGSGTILTAERLRVERYARCGAAEHRRSPNS